MKLDTGNLTLEQINALLLAIPMDLTFVDDDDIIKYYSGRENLIFSRDPKMLGTDVRSCHPDMISPEVSQILDELKAGKRDYFEAWHTNEDGNIIHTRYIAARDKDGTYHGCLETSQDVTKIRALSGTKKSLE